MLILRIKRYAKTFADKRWNRTLVPSLCIRCSCNRGHPA